MVQTWDGEKLILKSWIFLVDHFKTLRHEQNGAILQTAFSNAFSWKKVFVFWLKFYIKGSCSRGSNCQKSALVQVMAWNPVGNKSFLEHVG